MGPEDNDADNIAGNLKVEIEDSDGLIKQRTVVICKVTNIDVGVLVKLSFDSLRGMVLPSLLVLPCFGVALYWRLAEPSSLPRWPVSVFYLTIECADRLFHRLHLQPSIPTLVNYSLLRLVPTTIPLV